MRAHPPPSSMQSCSTARGQPPRGRAGRTEQAALEQAARPSSGAAPAEGPAPSWTYRQPPTAPARGPHVEAAQGADSAPRWPPRPHDSLPSLPPYATPLTHPPPTQLSSRTPLPPPLSAATCSGRSRLPGHVLSGSVPRCRVNPHSVSRHAPRNQPPHPTPPHPTPPQPPSHPAPLPTAPHPTPGERPRSMGGSHDSSARPPTAHTGPPAAARCFRVAPQGRRPASRLRRRAVPQSSSAFGPPPLHPRHVPSPLAPAQQPLQQPAYPTFTIRPIRPI